MASDAAGRAKEQERERERDIWCVPKKEPCATRREGEKLKQKGEKDKTGKMNRETRGEQKYQREEEEEEEERKRDIFKG